MHISLARVTRTEFSAVGELERAPHLRKKWFKQVVSEIMNPRLPPARGLYWVA